MQSKYTLEDTLALMRDLRARCEWDAAQTHESLRPYLIEEAHELDDALRDGDTDRMREELGDVLLQVLFHSVIAQELGTFDVNDVAGTLISKMRHRHPHLFGAGEKVPWERLKARRRASIGEGLPPGLPALHRAHRLQDRAAGIGFDWPDVDGPTEKVAEELEEVRREIDRGVRSAEGTSAVADEQADRHSALQGELGDLLFAVVNLCRKAGVHASLALDGANHKFESRMAGMEKLAAERGLSLGDMNLAELDALWDEVKADEAD